jgi:hypothetical protein
MIARDGRSVAVDDVKDMVESAYGRGPMWIEIRNATAAPGRAYGTYEESQTVGGSTSVESQRR